MTARSPGSDRRTSNVLSFRQARLTVARDEALTLDFALAEGAFVVAQLDDPLAIEVVLDAVYGLARPTGGALEVLGHDYAALSEEGANALRGLVGCIDDPPVFPPHVPVSESLLLAGRFHTRRREDAMLADAARLCCGFGFPGVPMQLPDSLPAESLRRVACVRALLDRPRLLLVAELETPIPADIVGALLRNLFVLQANGCGVLWLTLDGARLRDRRLPASNRLLQQDDRLGADTPWVASSSRAVGA